MRYLFLVILILGLCSHSVSQVLIPADKGSSVTFKIKNFGITVDGTFTGLKGEIRFDPTQLNSSRFEITVDANSIDTGIELRNKHLKKEDYFNVKTYPEIKFVSSKIESQSGTYRVTGRLTIKKTTKEIVFSFTAQKQSTGYLFKGEFPINRRDYEVGGSSFSMADDLNVFLSVSCIEK